MHVTLVHVDVKADEVEAFVAATRANHEASVREPGNRRFDVLQSAGRSDALHPLRGLRERRDAAAHKQTPHYARWRDTVAPMMAEPRQGVPMSGLFPSD